MTGCSYPIRWAVLLISELAARGVNLVAVQDGIDTTTGEGRVAFPAITSLAEADQTLARERGQFSVAVARRWGLRVGCPPIEVDVERASELRAPGRSFRQIAQALGVGVATVHRALSASLA